MSLIKTQQDTQRDPISHVRETHHDETSDLPGLKVKAVHYPKKHPPLTAVEKLFGQTGKRIDIVSPKHLLHTLPPNYPIALALDYILQFLEQLEECYSTDTEKLIQLRKLQTEQRPILERLQNKLTQVHQKSENAFFKNIHKKKVAAVHQQVFNLVNNLTRTSTPPPSNLPIEMMIPHCLKRIQESIRSLEENLEKISIDIDLFNFRARELADEYFHEFAKVEADTAALYVSHKEVGELHRKFLLFKHNSEPS